MLYLYAACVPGVALTDYSVAVLAPAMLTVLSWKTRTLSATITTSLCRMLLSDSSTACGPLAIPANQALTNVAPRSSSCCCVSG